MDFLRPVLGRIIASLVAALASYLYGKYGYTVDNETQAAIVATMFAIFGMVYAVVHKGVNSKINPLDAARISTAAITKDAANDVSNAAVSHLDTLPQHDFYRDK